MSEAQASAKPKTVRELVQAWQESGRKAARLQQQLREVTQYARRYRRDLVRLAEQTRSHKQQNLDLQAKLLHLLDRQQPPPQPEILEEIGESQEQIPAEYARVLLRRLHESQSLLGEYETLLQFRENQVHEMLSLLPAPVASPPASEFVVGQLKKELAQSRHRVRMLTQELLRSGGSDVAPSAEADPALQQQLAEKDSKLAEWEQRSTQLQEALQSRNADIQKAASTIQAAKARIQQLEQDVRTARTEGSTDDQVLLLMEEVSALQDEVSRLQDENEQLRVDAEALDRTDELAALEAQLDESQTARIDLLESIEKDRRELDLRLSQANAKHDAALQAVLGERSQLDARVKQLEEENARLGQMGGGSGGDPERVAKLEAAVLDLRSKLQQAAAKYQEVKAALIDKHRQLQDWQNKSVESDRNTDFTVNVVQTLEAALDTARAEAETERRKVAELERRLSGRPSEVSGEDVGPASTGDANIEAKLKEARRSAVRAQAEAGLKRKEAAKLQEELEQVKAALKAALGG